MSIDFSQVDSFPFKTFFVLFLLKSCADFEDTDLKFWSKLNSENWIKVLSKAPEEFCLGTLRFDKKIKKKIN